MLVVVVVARLANDEYICARLSLLNAQAGAQTQARKARENREKREMIPVGGHFYARAPAAAAGFGLVLYGRAQHTPTEH